MNWDAIGAIGEVVGAAGVLVTLVYLSLQIRSQNHSLEAQNRSMRIQNMRSRASEQRNLLGMQATPETTERAIEKAYTSLEELTPTERNALEAYLVSCLVSAECDYRLYQDGLITQEEWLPSRNQLKLFFHAPAAKSWWREVLNQLVAEGFRPEVDAVIAEAETLENPYQNKAAPNQAMNSDA